jgi:polyisoprenoid-binding protein YceI
VNTLNSNDASRDAHVKSADFLDAEKYPTIEFKSRTISNISGGTFTVAGDLTIHGVTKPVVLEVEGPTEEQKDPWGNTRVGASATTKIKRSDFGLVWNATLETGGIMLGDDLKLEIDVSLIKG